mmetsp:Transcript_12742/g.46603  ORF Transcript_12742/g.46603 Transcript_12742/m.46603 type:complete len:443 (-) Transcript_12742:336-1664(-)
MSLPTEPQALPYEALTFHAHAAGEEGPQIFQQISIPRENSLLRTILPSQDWYHNFSRDLQGIVPFNSQQAKLAGASSYADPKIAEQLSQLHAQASGQQMDLVQAMQAGIPASQPSTNLASAGPQTEMSVRAESVYKQVLEQQQQRRGVPSTTNPLSQANLQAVSSLVAQNPRFAETMSFLDLVRAAQEQENKNRLVSTPSQAFQAALQTQQNMPVTPAQADYSAAAATSDANAQNLHLPDSNLYPSAQANKSAAAATAAIRRQRRASMIKSHSEDPNSGALARSGPSKTVSVSTQSASELAKQNQTAGKRVRGKSQEDMDVSAEKKRQRAIRNRDSAKRHRERRQAYQNALEDEINTLHQQIDSLTQENEALRKALQLANPGSKGDSRLQELEKLKSLDNPSNSRKDSDQDDKHQKDDQAKAADFEGLGSIFAAHDKDKASE